MTPDRGDVWANAATVQQEQPVPSAEASNDTWSMVIEDMKERRDMGFVKYGSMLFPNNGRKNLIDAYQEALDLAVYLKNEIREQARYSTPEVKAMSLYSQYYFYFTRCCTATLEPSSIETISYDCAILAARSRVNRMADSDFWNTVAQILKEKQEKYFENLQKETGYR